MNKLPVSESILPRRIERQVVHGRKVGRQLGIPTANLRLAANEGPPFGIYAVLACAEGRWYAACASWGTRPHFDNGEPVLEVHLLDFAGDLYERTLEVEFMAKLRDEQIFASTAALFDQIAMDIRATRLLVEPALRERACLGSLICNY
jgi:riboflavin kinase/FMN adenylyltransferase